MFRLSLAALLTLLGITNVPQRGPAALPDRLADSTFWRIVTTFSEPSGTFPSENFVSNENEWQYVIPGALDRMKPMSAYLGVGPEQNFTYIAAFHPKIAFICDIRRQNMIQHLMYKALIEMSADRADFLSKLWSRRRPDGLDSSSDAATLVDSYKNAKPDSLFYTLNLGAIFNRLVNQHKFTLTADDSTTLRAVYSVFFSAGPDISYMSSSRGAGSNPFNINTLRSNSVGSGNGMTWIAGSNGVVSYSSGGTTTTYRFTTDSAGRLRFLRDSAGIYVPDTSVKIQPGSPIAFNSLTSLRAGGGYATFASLMTEDDGEGVNRGWLGSDAAFQWLKDFESRNLLVPVVGDFAGPKALKSIGGYVRDNHAHVSVFYTSNVEQYLFQNAVNADFYNNVATLPTDSNSIFIRSFASGFRGSVMARKPGSRLAQSVSSIDEIVRAHRLGALATYADLGRLQER